MKKRAIIGRDYSGSCSAVLTKIFNDKRKHDRAHKAFFMERLDFEMFQEALIPHGIFFDAEHIWDYNLNYNQDVIEMKLFWILDLTPSQFELISNEYFDDSLLFWDRTIPAFGFLQPKFLQYMNKPFRNRHAYTQVNLILDYHRQQKRCRGIEIFNLVDLIAFKMAIDDNRVEYEMCEFHKLIERTMNEAIKSNKFQLDYDNTLFDLNQYLNDTGIFVISDEMFEYLVYHFQHTIKKIIFENPGSYINVKFSNINSTAQFLNLHNTYNYALRVYEPDSTHKSSNILYEILSQVKSIMKITFDLDGEWNYAGHYNVSNIMNANAISGCDITISTKNQSHFIENFINWLKLSFGVSTKYFNVTFEKFERLQPYILNSFHVEKLKINRVQLDIQLIRRLRHCKYNAIEFRVCSLVNDRKERIEFLGHRTQNDQNILKLLDSLDDVKVIQLWNEEHTIGTIWKYVAYTMAENALNEFKFHNEIWVGRFCLQAVKFCINQDSDRTIDNIEIISLDDQISEEIYEYFGIPSKNADSAEEWDFYQ